MGNKNKIIVVVIIIFCSVASSVITYNVSTASKTSETSKVTETRLGNNNLPDLIVTDVTYEDPYIYVHYMNEGSTGSKADFLIRVSSNYNAFDGNQYYRFKVPEPGEKAKTGGFTPSLVGFNENRKSMIVMVEIDWEDRINELNKNNNVFYKQIELMQ